MNESADLTNAVLEIRDLLRLIAEPQIASRDQKRREDLLRIVGRSDARAKAVLLMDGSRKQSVIHTETGLNKGKLSVIVKELGKAQLLTGDPKKPQLAISIPSDFFQKAKER